MGFYLRKSLSFGPIRFNLSSSGIGASVGVRGLRFGAGPRGTYIRAGANGFYYSRTLSSTTSLRPVNLPPVPDPHSHQPTQSTHGPMVSVSHASINNLAEDSAAELLQDLQLRKSRASFGPWVLLLTIGLVFVLLQSEATPACVAALVFTGLAAGVFVSKIDQQRKTSVLFYDLDDQFTERYRRLYESLLQVARCQRMWSIDEQAKVYDRKYQAGASHLVNRQGAEFKEEAPAGIKTNISVLCLKASGRTVAFLPHCILVYDRESLGSISYESLGIDFYTTQFIESSGVPCDSQIVSHTWRYVNRDGGPDRRFSNNHQIPVVAYEELTLSGGPHFRQVLQFSKTGNSSDFRSAVAGLSQLTSKTQSHPQAAHATGGHPRERAGNEVWLIPLAFAVVLGTAFIGKVTAHPTNPTQQHSTASVSASNHDLLATETAHQISPSKKPIINGITYDGLAESLNLIKRGFHQEAPQLDSDQSSMIWDWRLSMPGKAYRVSMIGASGKQISLIKAELTADDPTDVEVYAKSFLSSIASLGGQTEQAKQAQQWVAANITQSSSTTIGALHMDIQTTGRVRWCLEIQPVNQELNAQ